MAEQNLYRFVDLAKSAFKNRPVGTIFELGARDCTETLEFHKLFPETKIHTFECNPATLPICRRRTKHIPQIKLVEKAVSDHKGTIKFYPINPEKTRTTWEDGNPGASSIFKASGKYPVEDYVQDEIEVETIRLADYMSESAVEQIDLLWMDIQGAELLALKGLGKKLRKVRLIHLEVEFIEIYSGQPLYKDLKVFLNRHGFLLGAFTNFGPYSADAVFMNIRSIPLWALPKQILKNGVLYWWKRHASALGSTRRRLVTTIKSATNRLVKIIMGTARKISLPLRVILQAYANIGVSGRPLLSFHRLASYYWLRRGKPLLRLDPNLLDPSSDEKIDIVIPLTTKDLAVAPHCISSVKQFIRHPIGQIILIGPANASLRKLAKDEGCVFVDELKVLPIKPADIEYKPRDIDRSGWLFQQFLKLNADSVAKTPNFLVMDADTVFCHPQIFLRKERPIVNHSDEYHQPYFDIYRRLLRQGSRSRMSFVAHHMLMNADVLKKLRDRLRNLHGKVWYEAILEQLDRQEFSGFSEYETYGNFLLSEGRRPVRLYWFNRLVAPDQISRVTSLTKKYGSHIKTLSFHTHEKL